MVRLQPRAVTYECDRNSPSDAGYVLSAQGELWSVDPQRAE